MYPTVDEKIMLEKRYARRSPPLPIYNTSSSSNDFANARARRSFITYILIVLAIFGSVLYGLPSLVHLCGFRGYRPGDSSPAATTTGMRLFAQSLAPAAATGAAATQAPSQIKARVPLEAHIMSKCPDARDCLEDLIVPAMERIADKVDFQLSYIGSVDDDGNIQCKHGPTECLGNMMGLCAQHLYPNDVKRWLGFSNCLTDDFERIPDKELAQGCSLEHGLDFGMLNDCMSAEGKGLDMLESSILRSDQAGVTKSCTVRVAGEEWCIRDGAQWKNCPGGHTVSDLIREVETRYSAD